MSASYSTDPMFARVAKNNFATGVGLIVLGLSLLALCILSGVVS